MRLPAIVYLPFQHIGRLFYAGRGSISSSKASGNTISSLLVLILASLFISVVYLLNSTVGFDFSKYQEVGVNFRNYFKVDRFFKTPVFNSHQLISSLETKPTLLDPRITINYYLENLKDFYSSPEHINKRLTMNFDWADWVDLSQADLFIQSYPNLLNLIEEDQLKVILDKMCNDEMQNQRDQWIDENLYDKHLYFDEQLKGIGICSAIWKKFYFQNPEKVLFETDKNFFEIDVKSRKSDLPKNLQTLKKNQVKREDNSKIVEELLKNYKKNGGELKDLHLKSDVSLPKESFMWDPDQDLQDLNNKKELNETEKKYKSFLQYAKDHAVQNAFYFTFPGLKVDRNAELHHYNFPFIRHIISHEERIAVIHHLVRSWFKLCENYGIVTWINYGNLIGWWFNAQNLPWDNDVDVQVSIQDLNRIGRELNNTIIVENPKNGNGLFWLQTDHVYSQQGSGNNFIDARFIDARTGIYIDISALWYTGDKHPVPNYLGVTKKQVKENPDKYLPVHCKHLQFFTPEDLFPLRRTIYEGAQTYIPRKVERILKRFYGDRPFNEFKCFDHNYQVDIGLWVPDEICKDPPTDLTSRFNDRGDITLAGACGNSDLQDQYNNAKDAIKLHWKEFSDYYKEGNDPDPLTGEDLPIFRPDPFEAFVKYEEQHGTRNYGM